MNDARKDPAADPPEEPDREGSEGEAKAADRDEASESAPGDRGAKGEREPKGDRGAKDEPKAKGEREGKRKRRRSWRRRRREQPESERGSGARRAEHESPARRRGAAKGAAAAKKKAETKAVGGRKQPAEKAKARPRPKDGARGKPRRPAGKRRPDAISKRIRSAVAKAGGWLERGRKILLIPAAVWMRLAEIAGVRVLALWRRALRPALVATWRALRRLLALAERHVTPVRAVAVVALGAALALAASQWVDYRSITLGNEAYSGEVGVVAAAPEVDHQRAGDAHSWVMLPLAAAAIVVVLLSLAGGRKRAHLLIAIGVAVIAISVIVDAPKGLDEGSAAVAYENAQANLLEGFWVQVAAGGVLVACGFLLPMQVRAATASSPRPTRGGASKRRARKAAVDRRGEKERRRPSLPKAKGRGAPRNRWGEGSKRRRGSGPSDATGSSA